MRRARAAERVLRFEDLSTDNPLLASVKIAVGFGYQNWRRIICVELSIGFQSRSRLGSTTLLSDPFLATGQPFQELVFQLIGLA